MYAWLMLREKSCSSTLKHAVFLSSLLLRLIGQSSHLIGLKSHHHHIERIAVVLALIALVCVKLANSRSEQERNDFQFSVHCSCHTPFVFWSGTLAGRRFRHCIQRISWFKRCAFSQCPEPRSMQNVAIDKCSLSAARLFLRCVNLTKCRLCMQMTHVYVMSCVCMYVQYVHMSEFPVNCELCGDQEQTNLVIQWTSYLVMVMHTWKRTHGMVNVYGYHLGLYW